MNLEARPWIAVFRVTAAPEGSSFSGFWGLGFPRRFSFEFSRVFLVGLGVVISFFRPADPPLLTAGGGLDDLAILIMKPFFAFRQKSFFIPGCVQGAII